MVTNWATSFSHYKNRGFRRFFGARLSFCVCFCLCPVICQFSKNSLFRKKGAKIGFFKFCVLSSFFEISLFLGLPKHYKNWGGGQNCVFFIVEREEKGPPK